MLIGYARVSTDDQDLRIQRAALNAAGCRRLKNDAREAGRTAADLYGEIIEGFLDRDADRFRKYLLTGPTSSPSVTLALAQPIVTRVRALADERDMVISDIVYTAVLLHLREFEGPAIAA